jgi:energy-converting hydrogenase Eha subunit B
MSQESVEYLITAVPDHGCLLARKRGGLRGAARVFIDNIHCIDPGILPSKEELKWHREGTIL